MIRPLRRRHRVMIVVLAVAIPVLFGLGLRARRMTPAVAELPSSVDGSMLPALAADAVLVSQNVVVPGGLGLTIRRLRPADVVGPERLFVEITADPHLPELLAYWAPGGSDGAGLPQDARLLGPLHPAVPALFDLPALGDRPGSLVLYSLAQGEVVETIALRGAEDR